MTSSSVAVSTPNGNRRKEKTIVPVRSGGHTVMSETDDSEAAANTVMSETDGSPHTLEWRLHEARPRALLIQRSPTRRRLCNHPTGGDGSRPGTYSRARASVRRTSVDVDPSLSPLGGVALVLLRLPSKSTIPLTRTAAVMTVHGTVSQRMR